MNLEDMNKLKKIIAQVKEVDESEIKQDFNLVDAGFNSITFIKLIIAIENYFSFEFEDDDLDIFKLQTLNKLVEYIENKRQKME